MSTTGASGAVRTAVDRARVLKEWDRSGLSARAFAERIGLSPWTLYDWRRRGRMEAAKDVSSVTPFVRVEPEAGPPPAIDGGRSNPIGVVVHAGGARIEFYGDPVEMFARTMAGLFRRC